jgi:hypothetical protein
MVGPAIKKFGTENNLSVVNGVMAGNYLGYFINLEEDTAYKTITVAAYLKDSEEVINKISYDIRMTAKNYVGKITNNDYCLQIVLNNTYGVFNVFFNILNLVIGRLKEYQIKGSEYCSICGEKSNESFSTVKMPAMLMPAHEACVRQFLNNNPVISQQYGENEDESNKSYVKGFLGALIGGIIGTIPWIILYLVGYVAVLGALLIGIAANFGYKKLGGLNGAAKLPILLISCVIALGVGFYVQYCHEIFIAFQSEGILLSETPAVFINALNTVPEYKTAVISNTMMSLIFAAVGIGGYLAYSRKQSNRIGR